MNDIYKKIASRTGGLCPFWKCFENDSHHNEVRKTARRIARKRLKALDRREREDAA